MSVCARQQKYRRWGGIITALLLAGAAWVMLWPWHDQVSVRRQLIYDLEKGQTWGEREWGAFLEEEAGRLNVIGCRQAPLRITTNIAIGPRPCAVLDILEKSKYETGGVLPLDILLSEYISDFQRRRQEAAGKDEPRTKIPNGYSAVPPPSLEADLQKYRQHRDIYQEQLDRLTQEYERASADLLVLEKTLNREIPLSRNSQFNIFIEPKLKQALAGDAKLQELHESAEAQRLALADIDARAGKAAASSELESLNQQRQRREKELQRLEYLIEERKELVAEGVKEDNKAAYYECVALLLKERRQSLESRRVQLQSAADDVQRTQKYIDALVRTLPPPQTEVSPEPSLGPVVRQGQATEKFLYWRYALGLGLGLGLMGWLAGRSIGNRLYQRCRHNPAAELFGQALTDEELQSFDGASIEEAITTAPLPLEADSITISPKPVVMEEQMTNAALINLDEDHQEESSLSSANITAHEFDQPEERETSVPALEELIGPAPLETIRQLRENTPCPILLFAAEPCGEGSPRGMVNLAISLVREGLKVLLVETEPGPGELAAIFELPQGPGFLDWRRGDVWLNQAARPGALANLTVMGAGAAGPDQDQQEDISRERHRWDLLRTRFDVVLLYGPSALASEPQTDVQRLGKQLLSLVDGVCVQIRDAAIAAKQAERIQQLLSHYRAEFMGWALLTS